MVGGQDSISSVNSVAKNGPTQVESIEKPKRASSTSSIDVMRDEIEDQIEALPAFASQLEQYGSARRSDSSDLIFTGSGDSYASSLFAHYFSNGLSPVADPYELMSTPDLCDDKIVFITSVSGRTKANVRLAKRIRKISRKRIAITANPLSPLARECDDTINLLYRNRGLVTPGTLSFTLSLLAVASRIKALPLLRGLDGIDERARKWSKRLKIFPHGDFLLLGSGIGYALSAYGAFKIHEVLGQPAEYEHTEQVGHSRLFSLRKNDNIICFATVSDERTAQVSRTLTENGFHSQLLTSNTLDPVIAGLEAAFSYQHLAVNLAKKRRLNKVAFLTDKVRLALSSRLIY